MPSPVRVTVRYKDRVRAALRSTVPGIDAEVEPVLERGAGDIANLARKWVPYRSGRLYESIETARISDDIGQRADQQLRSSIKVTPFVGPSRRVSARAQDTLAWGVFAHWTWRFPEFGTEHQNAQPAFFPAFRIMRRRIRSQISRAIGRAIKKAGFKTR